MLHDGVVVGTSEHHACIIDGFERHFKTTLHVEASHDDNFESNGIVVAVTYLPPSSYGICFERLTANASTEFRARDV
jgi:hypothetical protein